MTTALRFITFPHLAFIAATCCYTTLGIAGTHFISTTNVNLHIPITSNQEIRFLSTVKQERDFSCGSAAVATLLAYHYEFPVNEHDVFSLMYRNGDQQQIIHDGFSLLDMKNYLEAKGFDADGFRLPLDELANIGVPAITLINDNGYAHFVVIKGVMGRYVLLGDPARGTRAMTRSRFEKMWNGIAFVIHNTRVAASAHFNRAEEWQMVSLAPLHTALPRQSIANLLLTLPGPYEF